MNTIQAAAGSGAGAAGDGMRKYMYKQYTEQYDRLWFLFCSKASGSATIGENEKKKNDNGNDKDNDEAKNHSNTRNTIYRYRRCTGPEMRVSHSRQPPRDRRRIGIGMGRGNRGWSSVLWIVVVWVLSAHNNTIPVDNNNNNCVFRCAPS
mmetsp:Transcript_4607/g.13275  ORF Transcript_4607/g.13275 Transcript_4607/m.13275 type:complete len:150 (-) Transcript_4607:1010-1459(-)